MKIRTMAVALAGLLLLAFTSLAQISALEGDVTGLDGKPVQGAVIQIVRSDIKGTYHVKTDKKGHYLYNGLPLGTYTVSCEVDGKEMDKVNNIHTTTSPNRIVNFDLKASAAQSAALGKAAESGNLSKDQERGMSSEQKKQLEELYKKREESMKKNAALNEAYNAGKTAVDNKQYDAAIENFNKAAELDPKQGAVWASLAQTYEALAKTKTGADYDANMQKAADTWTKAIALNPEDAGLHNNYALALAGGKKFPEAQAELEKAATINPPGAGQYYYNLGALEVNSGQNDAASEAFKKAITYAPPYPEAFYQYGLTLVAKASFDKDGKILPVPGTVEAFQKYLELAPEGSHAQEAKAMLGTLGSTLETQYKNPDAGKKKKK
jgi:tetratricopeptide (TPR) repeat protein